MKDYNSNYEALFHFLPDLKPITIVEVGMNDGQGAISLKKKFPNSQIFTIDEHVRAPDYTDNREVTLQKLKGVATVIIERSPLPYQWPFKYDLCVIDIGSDPDINFQQIKYWEKWGNNNSVLAIVIPRASAQKVERGLIFKSTLLKEGYVFEMVFNWYVLKHSNISRILRTD